MKLTNKLFKNKHNISMYTLDTWSDCQEAKSFFAQHEIEVDYKNIDVKENREELKDKYKRMAVPTIIIGNNVILGFADNRPEIMKLLEL